MDPDEALARQLQAQEDAQAAQWHQQQERQHEAGGAAGRDFMAQLQRGMQNVLRYEQPGAQEAARQAMPLERMRAAAADAASLSLQMREDLPLAAGDALVLEMLAWFKTEFFTWVDKPACGACGSRETFGTGTEAPTPQEAADGNAGRTEVYRCGACAATVRLPRFNDPVKLLRTRRGRCGEWANCFCLCLRAAGFEARWVHDWADHVWCEYWSEGLRRWIQADPCEAAWDRPLLYEAGWSKPQSYVVAFGRNGAADVTRRYTADFAKALARRTLVPEAFVKTALDGVNGQLRSGLPEAARRKLEAADVAEAAELAAGAAPAEPLPGRQTGSLEWRAARGELGAAAAAHPVAKAPSQPPATRWRRAAESSAPEDSSAAESSAPEDRGARGQKQRVRRVHGAAVRASGENAPLETAVKVLDGRQNTKWLDFGGGTPGCATWLEVALLPTSNPANAARLASYALTSAADAPERDPSDFLLQGWLAADAAAEPPAAAADETRAAAAVPPTAQPAAAAGGAPAADGGGAAAAAAPQQRPETAAAAAAAAFPAAGEPLQGWRVLDAREGVRFSSRGERQHFQVAKAPLCSRWHLIVSRLRDPQAACAVQLASLDLFCHPPDVAGAGAASEQLARLEMAGTPDASAAAGARVPGSHGSGRTAAEAAAAPAAATPARAVAETAAASSAISGTADAKTAFEQRVKRHFGRLMAAGGVAPAAAAAQALQLAALE